MATDTKILEQALAIERDELHVARYTFQLAQTYRSSGEIERALQNYLLRAKLGYSQDEVFYSLYVAAQLKEQLALPEQDVIDAYLEACGAMPTRAEALHGASRFCRLKGRYEEGFQLARQGLAVGRPANGLFIESWIYDYGLLDELAVNGYWSYHYRETYDACVKLLVSGACPLEQRERIAANARFALEKLPHGSDLPSECSPRQKQSGANTVTLRYRPLFEGVPAPQPIRLQVPGWAGKADKLVAGVTPQPWHCMPYVDAAVYGLELRFVDNA